MNKKAIKTGGISRDAYGSGIDTHGGFIEKTGFIDTGAVEIQATGDI